MFVHHFWGCELFLPQQNLLFLQNLRMKQQTKNSLSLTFQIITKGEVALNDSKGLLPVIFRFFIAFNRFMDMSAQIGGSKGHYKEFSDF